MRHLPFDQIPSGPDLPDVVHAIVEIPKGRRNKFEVDKATGLMKLDRHLFSSSHYPGRLRIRSADARGRW